jgi:hypothetical protein
MTKSHSAEKIMSSLEPHFSITHVKPQEGLTALKVSIKVRTLLFSIFSFAFLVVFCLFTPSISSRILPVDIAVFPPPLKHHQSLQHHQPTT